MFLQESKDVSDEKNKNTKKSPKKQKVVPRAIRIRDEKKMTNIC